MKKLFLFIYFFSFNACALEKGLIFDWQRPAEKQETVQMASSSSAPDDKPERTATLNVKTLDENSETKSFEMFLREGETKDLVTNLEKTDCKINYSNLAAIIICYSKINNNEIVELTTFGECRREGAIAIIKEHSKKSKKTKVRTITAKCN